jgi:hypothetical protein
MSIKIHVTAPRLDQAENALAQYPEIADKYHRVALRAAVDAIGALIEPDIPVGETGFAKESFATRVAVETMSTFQDQSFGAENVTGFGTRFLVGRVGWDGNVRGWYINIVEHGASAHDMERDGLPARFMINGRWVQMHQHPGFPARNFMLSKEDQANGIVETEMIVAGERILAALAKAGGA